MNAMKVARFAGFDGVFYKESPEPRAYCRTSAVLAGLTILFAMGAAAQTPAPPVLNTPYQCANGITYTVTVCKPFGATDQWCETIEKQNGNLVTAMDSSWSSMTGRLKGCTVATPAPATPPAPQPPANSQQTFNPSVSEGISDGRPDHGADKGLEPHRYCESPGERDARFRTDDQRFSGSARRPTTNHSG